MKVNTKYLIGLIRASINEAKYYIGDDKGNVDSAIRAFHGGYTKDAMLGNIRRPGRTGKSNERAQKAFELMRSPNIKTRQQGRELAKALIRSGTLDQDILQDLENDLKFIGGSLELTHLEKTARDHMPDNKLELDRDGSEQPQILIDKDSLFGAMKSKSDGILTHFGFKFVQDMDSTGDYSDFGPLFRFQAEALGCKVEELAFVASEDSKANKTMIAIYDMMRERNAIELDMPGDIGNYGQNGLYEIDGLKILTTGHMGGYYTVTICGQ